MKRLYKIVRLIDTNHIILCTDVCLDTIYLGAQIQIADGEVSIDIGLIVFSVSLSIFYRVKKGG